MLVSPGRLVVAILAVSCGVLALAGCGDDPASEPSESAPSSGGGETPSPAPSESQEAQSTPVDAECSRLVPQPALDMLFSDFAPDPDYVPTPGSTADEIESLDGQTCGWVNSEGVALELAIARLPDERLTALKNDRVMTSNSVPTYVVEGYFTVDGGTGQAEAFSDPYWVVAASSWFEEPGAATPVVEAALMELAGLG